MGKRRNEIDPIERYLDITRANRTERPHSIYPPRLDERLTRTERRTLGVIIIALCLAAAGCLWQREGGISAGVAVFACLALVGVFLLLIRDPAEK